MPGDTSDAENDSPILLASSIIYALLSIWLVAQFSFGLGSFQEPDCPVAVYVISLLLGALMFLGMFTHCLIFASYQDSRYISVKYQRERLKMESNAANLRKKLIPFLLTVTWSVFFGSLIVGPVFLMLEGLPVPQRSFDEVGCCRVTYVFLWLDAVFAFVGLVLYLAYRRSRPELLEPLFNVRWGGVVADQGRE